MVQVKYPQMQRMFSSSDINEHGKSGVYAITAQDEKRYVGATKDLTERYSRHNRRARIGTKSPLYDAMRKQGINNCTFCILEFCTPEQLPEKEQHWIKLYDTNNPEHGYNTTAGGDHLICQSDDTRDKKRESAKAAYRRAEFQKKGDAVKQYKAACSA
jgi:group I intron endonuclease